jgi:hypothetical protein
LKDQKGTSAMWEGCADIGRDGGLAVTAFFSSLLRHLSRSNVNVAFSRDSVFFFVPRVFCTAGEMHQSRQPAVVVYRHWHFTVLLVVALVGRPVVVVRSSCFHFRPECASETFHSSFRSLSLTLSLLLQLFSSSTCRARVIPLWRLDRARRPFPIFVALKRRTR